MAGWRGRPSSCKREPIRGAFFMEKWFCLGSMGVAGLLCLLFVLDIAVATPFGGTSMVVDILGLLASGLVGYLGFDAYKDLS